MGSNTTPSRYWRRFLLTSHNSAADFITVSPSGLRIGTRWFMYSFFKSVNSIRTNTLRSSTGSTCCL